MVKTPSFHCRGHGFDPWSGDIRASLLSQLVKNLPVMQETPVRFLGQENDLEKE